MALATTAQLQADRDLTRRARLGPWVYLFFLLVTGTTTTYIADHLYVFGSACFLAVGFCAIRTWVAAKVQGEEGESQNHWRWWLFVTILGSSTWWGLLYAVTYAYYGLVSWPTMILATCTSGTSAGGVLSMASHKRLMQAHVIAMGVPATLVIGFWFGGREGIGLALLHVLYFSLLFILGGVQNEIYWRMLRDGERLRIQNLELETARAAAEHASRSKSAFVATVTHELRTPLNAIIGYAELLQEEAQAEGLHHFEEDLEKIRRAGKHQLSLVNDILDLSKIEAGRLELNLEPYRVDHVVADAVATVRPLAGKNRNRLEVRVDESISEAVGDPMRMRQSLFNLLANACKFTEDGEVSLDVTREQADGRDWIACRVRDTGIGMTEQQVGQLFSAFYQADGSHARKYGGTGLGLTITKRLSHLMGGDVTVESVAGQGSTFTLRVPAHVDAALPEA
ncbi:MAG: ATP-binding protein [Bryobacteraceae bacterium]